MNEEELKNAAASYLVGELANRKRIDPAVLAREFMLDVVEPNVGRARLFVDYDAMRKDVLSVPLADVPVARLIKLAEVTAIICVIQDLKMSQIRKFMDGVKRISAAVRLSRPEDFDKAEAELLKVPLVYAAARQKAAGEFVRTFILAIDEIQARGKPGRRDWERFNKLIEGVVAYHKFYRGGD